MSEERVKCERIMSFSDLAPTSTLSSDDNNEAAFTDQSNLTRIFPKFPRKLKKYSPRGEILYFQCLWEIDNRRTQIVTVNVAICECREESLTWKVTGELVTLEQVRRL